MVNIKFPLTQAVRPFIMKMEVILMKRPHPLLNARCARAAAGFLQYACYFVMAFCALCLLLSCLGRQTFVLHTGTEVYDAAICAEENHDFTSRSMTVSMEDPIHIRANEAGQVDPGTQAALTLLFAVQIVPMAVGYWFLSRVFANVHRGRIFVEPNAACLLYYGLLQCFSALCVPFLKLLICAAANQFTASQISISTGSGLLNDLVPGIAVLVAAYILYHGIALQDEVDHTL